MLAMHHRAMKFSGELTETCQPQRWQRLALRIYDIAAPVEFLGTRILVLLKQANTGIEGELDFFNTATGGCDINGVIGFQRG